MAWFSIELYKPLQKPFWIMYVNPKPQNSEAKSALKPVSQKPETLNPKPYTLNPEP